MNLIEQVLIERFEELGLAPLGFGRRLQSVVLTPRFPTSRHVVALVFSDGDPRPRVVAKIPRRSRDDDGVRTEARVLRLLKSLAADAVPGVPAVLGTVDVDGRTMLVETAVHGVALDPAQVLRNPDGAVTAGVRFLAGRPMIRRAEDNTNWYAGALTQPLAALARLAPPEGEIESLCARTHAVLEPLRQVPLPAVVEHGDMSHPNLFLTEDRSSLLVIDWERATVEGLPGHDLVFFLQYVSQCMRGAVTRPDQLAAFDDAFVGPGGWARPVLATHLAERGVSPDLAGLLVLASWARTAASLVPRLGAGGPAGGSEATALAEALTADRDVALWRHALDRAEQRRLG
jgi:aminoglycoside phosphotransferase (APT) family kinase protein